MSYPLNTPLGRFGVVTSEEGPHGCIAVNPGNADNRLYTASLRVDYLRQFHGGSESRYVGTALRIGRSSAIGEAQAVGGDGNVAIIALLTAYR
jgi:acyl-coenzyme A thioesterase PaaI-like protein